MSTTTPRHSRFQREEVAAATRLGASDAGPDRGGIAIATDAARRLVAELPEACSAWETWRGEVTVTLDPTRLVEAATFVRDELGFAMLSDISPIDWLDRHDKRFCVSYVCSKLVLGAPRLRLHAWVDEGEDLPSLIGVWPTADWHEREAWDFFGIAFSGREPMRRLIMDDDWVGHPLRKDYPMGGEPVKFTNSLREV